jgi:hypothetical protein
MVVASPDKPPDTLINAYAQVSAANQCAIGALAAVLTQFHKHSIDCLLLKGADILSRLYGVRGVRPMADVDLLVRERDMPAIDRLFRNLGCRPVIDGNPAYEAPDQSLVFDLITTIWYAEDTDAIWRRAIQRTVEGVPVKAMGTDDLFIYLTAYSVLHRGYFPPSFARDIALLIEKEPPNWTFILEEAVRVNLKLPLYHGLSYATRKESIPMPAHVPVCLAPASRIERIALSVLGKLVTDIPLDGLGHLLLPAFLPGRKKWRHLRQVLWPSPDFLRCRYGEHGAASPLRTRLARTAQLTIQANCLLGRIVWRLAGRH